MPIKSLFLFALLLFPFNGNAETTAITAPAPREVSTTALAPMPVVRACSNPTTLLLYRCVCRITVRIRGGGYSSEPLFMNGSSLTYSTSSRDGEACSGTFRADDCRSALNGATATGTLSCALVEVSEGNETVVR